jgi:hypothetical protein
MMTRLIPARAISTPAGSWRAAYAETSGDGFVGGVGVGGRAVGLLAARSGSGVARALAFVIRHGCIAADTERA